MNGHLRYFSLFYLFVASYVCPPCTFAQTTERLTSFLISDTEVLDEQDDLRNWLDNTIWSNSNRIEPATRHEAGHLDDVIQFSQTTNVNPLGSEAVPNESAFDYLPMEAADRPNALGSRESLDLDADPTSPLLPRTLVGRLWQDELHFYSPKSLAMIGGGFLVGAAFANTNWDSGIQRHLQSSLHHANTDEWLETLHANKELGDGHYTLPVFAGAWALRHLLPDNEYAQHAGTWGERSIRGFVVGAPAVIVLQMATGASRPGESYRGSEWQPFQDNNGVSGHAFMGALPFITAAKMTDSVALKSTFYAASALAPLSRTGDGAHYPSQVMLGWWMAYAAATAVHATDNPNSNWSLYPTASSNSSGMLFEYRF